MKITFVTESHAWGDEKAEIDIPSRSDHNDHTNWLNGHEGRLRGLDGKISDHDQQIGWIWEKVNKFDKPVEDHGRNIGWLWDKVNNMPQALRDALEQVANEVFADKLVCFARQVDVLREERNKVAQQLTAEQQLREQVRGQIEELKLQLDVVGKYQKSTGELLQGLTNERKQSETQLAELKRQQEEVRGQIEELKRQLDVASQCQKSAGDQLLELTNERKNASDQLTEVQRKQKVVQVQIDKLECKCSEADELLSSSGSELKKMQEERKLVDGQLEGLKDGLSQLAGIKASIPIPKKFAKFLFVNPISSQDKEN